MLDYWLLFQVFKLNKFKVLLFVLGALSLTSLHSAFDKDEFLSRNFEGFFTGFVKGAKSEKFKLTSCSFTHEKGQEREPETKQLFNTETFVIHFLGETPNRDTFLESVIFKRISNKEIKSFFSHFRDLKKSPLENAYGYDKGEKQWVELKPKSRLLNLYKEYPFTSSESSFFKKGDLVNYALSLKIKRISGDSFELDSLKLVGQRRAGADSKPEKVLDVVCRELKRVVEDQEDISL